MRPTCPSTVSARAKIVRTVRYLSSRSISVPLREGQHEHFCVFLVYDWAYNISKGVSMTIDPTTITPMNQLAEDDLNTVVTTHGTIDTTGAVPRLVEVDEDYSGARLPISIPLADAASLENGAYAVVSGTFETNSEHPAFGLATVTVDTKMEYAPSLDDHASETSPTTAYDTIDEILAEFSDPIPVRYVIETAIEQGIERETAADVLSRMESAGNIYSPEPGRLAGM